MSYSFNMKPIITIIFILLATNTKAQIYNVDTTIKETVYISEHRLLILEKKNNYTALYCPFRSFKTYPDSLISEIQITGDTLQIIRGLYEKLKKQEEQSYKNLELAFSASKVIDLINIEYLYSNDTKDSKYNTWRGKLRKAYKEYEYQLKTFLK